MRILILATLGITLMTACSGTGATDTPSGPRTVRLMSHDSFAVSEEVIQAFEADNNAIVEFLPSGDTGAALNQAILSKGNPLADVFFGGTNSKKEAIVQRGTFLNEELVNKGFAKRLF